MHNFFRKNNKKLLAIFGVFLMISFVATARMPSAGERAAAPIGMIGDTKILSTEVDNAKSDFAILAQTLMIQMPNGGGEWQQLLTLPGLRFLMPMGEEPKLFLLLQKEARQMGIAVNDQPIDQQLSRFIGAPIAVRKPDGSVVQLSDLANTDEAEYGQRIQSAGQNLLSVLMAWNRAADVNKISQPLRDFMLAQEHQTIQVRTVAFNARKQLSRVPAPTTQQLEGQFNRFADIAPTGSSSQLNPFGFGYQIADRYRLETIAIPRPSVTAAVAKTKTDYDWDVAAHYYYNKHKADFPSTRPATLPDVIAAPTTHPTASATTHPATAATKPPEEVRYEEVEGKVMTAVMTPQIDVLEEKIQRAIATTLAADWAAYHAANPATQPTSAATSAPSTQPAKSVASSLGVPYDSDDYLSALATKIQKDFDVLPVVQRLNKPITVDDASHTPGIGLAHSADGSLTFTDALTDPNLLPLQPSVPLSDDASTSYTFRVRERIAAHRPASIKDVASIVEADWKLSEAFDLCKQDAAHLVEAAKTTGLTDAARAANLPVETPPPFALGGRSANEPIAGLPLKGDAIDTFRRQCRTLLTAAAEHKPPVTTVESPIDATVLIAELASVTPDWPEGKRQLAEAQVNGQLRMQLSRPLQQEWFSLPAVTERLGYTDLKKDKPAS